MLINLNGEVKRIKGDEVTFTSLDVDWRQAIDEMMQLNPHILCRTNKEVKQIMSDGEGHYEVSTIHAAKGLEYPYVIVIDSSIDSKEDLNVSYVALTRAQNGIMIVPRDYFMRWCASSRRK